MDIIELIESQYDDLTNTQKKIADYLISNPAKICYITLAKLSKEIGCSEITLLNFSKKIGCGNFLNLKKAFIDFNENKISQFSSSSIKNTKLLNIETDNFLKSIIAKEKEQIVAFYEEVNFTEIEKVCNKILKSNFIYIIGHDSSKKLGNLFYTRLKVLNLTPVLIDLEDMYKTEFKLRQITKDDTVFFISFPNYYYASEGVADLVSERTDNFILLTDSDDSPVSSYAKNILYCETSSEIFNNSWLTPLACLNLITNLIAIKLNIK